jgi:hypothetical protein
MQEEPDDNAVPGIEVTMVSKPHIAVLDTVAERPNGPESHRCPAPSHSTIALDDGFQIRVTVLMKRKKTTRVN